MHILTFFGICPGILSADVELDEYMLFEGEWDPLLPYELKDSGPSWWELVELDFDSDTRESELGFFLCPFCTAKLFLEGSLVTAFASIIGWWA